MVAEPTSPDDVAPPAPLRLYSTCGLTLASDLDLPLESARGPAWDAAIRREPVPARICPAIVERVAYQADRGRFLLEVRGVARYLVAEGRQVGMMALDGAPLAAGTPFLLRDVVAALLLQRGVLALRASAVAGPRGAILFLGAPGLGKSSLAAALWQRGYGVIADHVCALGRGSGGEVCVRPQGTGSLELWRDMAEHLAIEVAGCDAVRPGQQRYRVPAAPAACPAGGLGVDQVFVLRRDNRAAPGLGEVRGLARLEELMGALHHRALLQAFGLAPSQVRLLLDLARQAGFGLLTRPAWPCRLRELSDLVEQRVAAHARPSA